MAIGTAALVSVLLGLSSFGVEANQKAPSAAEILRHAPGDADIGLHVDVQALLPHNYQALTEIPGEPMFQGSELAASILDVTSKVEMARGMAKSTLGIDPLTDIHSVTVWLQPREGAEPRVLMVVRGNLPGDLLEKAASLIGGDITQLHGKTAIADGEELVGIAADGSALFGSRDWVEPRLSPKWKRASASGGIAGRDARAILSGKPFLAFFSAPSDATIALAEADLAGDPDNQLLLDIVRGHEFAGLYLSHNALGWRWRARDAAGFSRARRASEGIIHILRASHHAGRGISELFFAMAPSLREQMGEAAATLEKHQTEIEAFVDAFIGDGRFKTRTRYQARQKLVSVEARGRELKDVLPAAAMIIPGAVGWLYVSAAGPHEATVDAAAKPAEIRAVPATPPAATRAVPVLDLRDAFERARARPEP